jgi:ketosteroid isomerase-like protein
MTATAELETTLKKFIKAAEANDGKGLAALFTPDGVYDDYFFGPFKGPQGIAEFLQHTHDGGRDYKWDFFDVVSDGKVGYARYCFSYVSTLPESKDKAVLFEGMSCFKLQGGKIAHYSEVFDRGMALTQLDFAAERIKKNLAKWAKRHNAGAEKEPHVARLRKLGASVLG